MILTFIDTETTGLDLMQHEIIEIAMMRIDVDKSFNYGQMMCYDAKIKPQYIRRAAPQALKINGYTKAKWTKAVPRAVVAEKIREWVNESNYVVGQNLVFDYNFINQMFDRMNIERPKFPKYYDTKYMANKLVQEGKLKRTALDYLCENYNIPVIGRAHTALTDVLRTFELFKKLKEEVKLESLSFKKPYDPFAEQK